jgi:hypothetical protein
MDTPIDEDATAKLKKSTRKEITRRTSKDGSAMISYPVNSRMIELRLLAESLHRQWLLKQFEFVRNELRTASRRDLAVLSSLMTDLTPQLRRLEFSLWLAEDPLTENDFDAEKMA